MGRYADLYPDARRTCDVPAFLTHWRDCYGTIDVNGLKGQGEAAIKDVYKKIAAGTPKRPGVFRMLLTNVSVVVNGNTAKAETLWTGVNSPTIEGLPKFAEQGTERDDLVKVNGHWLFKLRVITSNAGRQTMFRKKQPN